MCPTEAYYSTPFTRWQGALANENALMLGANTAKRFFESRGWDAKDIRLRNPREYSYQKQWFYGGAWVAALMGATESPGVLVSQACSTGTYSIYQAGMGVETGLFNNCWRMMADRMSKARMPSGLTPTVRAGSRSRKTG